MLRKRYNVLLRDSICQWVFRREIHISYQQPVDVPPVLYTI